MGQKPIIRYKGKLYIFDDKSLQIQNIEDMSDIISFSELDMSLLEEA